MGTLKKLFLFSVIMIGFCAASFAKQISFQIVQVDKSRDYISDKSYDIESKVLDAFFDSGFIVTTSESKASEYEDEDGSLWSVGLGDAFNGYSDYFVQIEIVYVMNDKSRTAQGNINKIEWTLASAKTGSKLKKETISEIKIVNGQEDLDSIAKNLVKNINSAIKA